MQNMNVTIANNIIKQEKAALKQVFHNTERYM